MGNCQQEDLFRKNYQRSFGLRLPDMDTVTLVFQDLDEDQLQSFKKLLIHRLIKRKVLDRFRLNGMLLVAIDGTGLVPRDLISKRIIGTIFHTSIAANRLLA